MVAGVVSFGELTAVGSDLYWLENRPDEGGRVTLIRSTQAATDAPIDLTPAPYSVRSRVHEYGGGTFCVTHDAVVFINAADQNLYRIQSGDISRVTDTPVSLRYADLAPIPGSDSILCVVEDHVCEGDVSNALAIVDLESGQHRLIHEGRDFCASPRLSPDGSKVALIAWDHPCMPWDGTQLLLFDLDEDLELRNETVLAGGANEAVMQPTWLPDGSLCFVSDVSGYLNLYRYDQGGTYQVCEDDAEYGSPPWVFGLRDYAPLDARFVAAIRKQQGAQEMVLIDLLSGLHSPLHDDCATYSYPVASNGELFFVAEYASQAPTIAALDLALREERVITRPPLPDIETQTLACAEHIAFPARDGTRAFGYYYAPAATGHSLPGNGPDALRSGACPLMVMSHGGPTGATSGALNLTRQFFTSRGWAVLDVNYRGSTGYGVDYRRALDGRWGELDVSDCEDGARHLIARGLADPARIAIRGGSAGGYTTLAALAQTETFRAGASHSGIGDLRALVNDTHKFESRYLEGLIGSEQALADRSPIRHLASFNCPAIFFQGGEDKIVPPNQAQAMVAALEAKGLPVAYVEFPEEGHGFRDATNIVHAIESEFVFLCTVFDLPRPEDMSDVEIKNL